MKKLLYYKPRSQAGWTAYVEVGDRATYYEIDPEVAALAQNREYFTDSHATPSHQLQHQPVPGVHGLKDDLINSFLIDDIPLDSLAVAEYALGDKTQAMGIAEYKLLGSLPEPLQTNLLFHL